MLLYKYRSFDNFEFIADIILNERLYCAHFENLNDPCEGIYLQNMWNRYTSAPAGQGPRPEPRRLSSMEHYPEYAKYSNRERICSLSARIDDIRMWSFYSGNHSGIAFEIEFSDESNLEKINYMPNLSLYSMSSHLPAPPQPENILKNKLDLWSFEEEYRLITDAEYFSVQDKIKTIYLGHRFDSRKLALLEKLAPNIPIKKTWLNPITTKIVVSQ